jgi:hypothetical protein
MIWDIQYNRLFMEDTMNQDKPELLEMHLDYDGGNTLQEAIRWSKFLSIVGICGIGFLLLVIGIGTPFAIETYGQLMPEGIGIIGLVVVAVVVYFLVLGWAAVMLLRFSRLTQRGMEVQDQQTFNRGLKCLKVFFIITCGAILLQLAGNIYSLIIQF